MYININTYICRYVQQWKENAYVLTDVHRPKKGKVWSELFKKESELFKKESELFKKESELFKKESELIKKKS